MKNELTRLLFLIRHAKSSWDDPGLKDFDRPLNKRGQVDATEMGRRLSSLGMKPGLILSSPAKRAQATAKKFASETGYPIARIVHAPEIYLATPGQMLSVIQKVTEEISTLFIVGHNPGITELANDLGNLRIENIPTCGICAFSFKGTWKELGQPEMKLLFFAYPKDGAGGD